MAREDNVVMESGENWGGFCWQEKIMSSWRVGRIGEDSDGKKR